VLLVNPDQFPSDTWQRFDHKMAKFLLDLLRDPTKRCRAGGRIPVGCSTSGRFGSSIRTLRIVTERTRSRLT
jgi:hypothetical protein